MAWNELLIGCLIGGVIGSNLAVVLCMLLLMREGK